MKVHGLQFDIAWHDREENFARIRSLASAAPIGRGDLLALPEMYSSGFSMDVAAIEEGAVRPAERFLAALAKEHGACALGGVVRRDPDGRGRNEAVVFDQEGREHARYAKLFPFALGGETRHFRSGDALAVFEWAGLRVAAFICYDLRFPEVFRRAALAGTDLFVVIANWPAPRAAHWRALLIARAIENQAYVLGVNRCGEDPSLKYVGGSLFVGPGGEILAEAGDRPEVVTGEPDLAALEEYRKKLPFLEDLRPEFLGVEERTQP